MIKREGLQLDHLGVSLGSTKLGTLQWSHLSSGGHRVSTELDDHMKHAEH